MGPHWPEQLIPCPFPSSELPVTHLDLSRAWIVVSYLFALSCHTVFLWSLQVIKFWVGINTLLGSVVFACSSKRTQPERCKWLVFCFLFSNRELPKCFCPWIEQSAIVLKWIILYLAVICQSASHARSRCAFWVTAITGHLGSYLLVVGRFGGGEWWKKGNWGLASSLVYFEWWSPKENLLSLNP